MQRQRQVLLDSIRQSVGTFALHAFYLTLGPLIFFQRLLTLTYLSHFYFNCLYLGGEVSILFLDILQLPFMLLGMKRNFIFSVRIYKYPEVILVVAVIPALIVSLRVLFLVLRDFVARRMFGRRELATILQVCIFGLVYLFYFIHAVEAFCRTIYYVSDMRLNLLGIVCICSANYITSYKSRNMKNLRMPYEVLARKFPIFGALLGSWRVQQLC